MFSSTKAARIFFNIYHLLVDLNIFTSVITRPRGTNPVNCSKFAVSGVKYHKMALIFWLLLLICQSVTTSPVSDKDKRSVHQFTLSTSDWCENPEPNTKCPGSNSDFDMKVNDLCMFQCKSSEDITCMESGSVAVFFCIQEDTTCAEGIGWTVDLKKRTNNDSFVSVIESNCPSDFYQDEPSVCYNACKKKHESLDVVPKQFEIFLKGNNTHPTILRCNNTAGYYSTYNQSFFRYDDSFIYNYSKLCTHINISNPCSRGKTPLYNGTCVDMCRPGYERDAEEFQCRYKSGKDNSVGVLDNTMSAVTVIPRNEDTGSQSKGNPGYPEDSDIKINEPQGKSERTEAVPWYQRWYFIVLIVTVVVIAVIYLVIVVYRKCISSRNQHDLEAQNKDCKKQLLLGKELTKIHNDTMTQTMVDNSSEYMKSVGALMYENRIAGTVFRVGDDLVLTAFHVIRNIINVDPNGDYDYSPLEAENVFINFNASICDPARVMYRVLHIFSSNNPHLDFSILRITNTAHLPKKLFLYKYNHEQLRLKSLSGIGYGNPENQNEKHLDPICPIICSADERIKECEEWLQTRQCKRRYSNALAQIGYANPEIVNQGYCRIDKEPNIFLDVALQQGGSGSPFLTSDGKVIGLLTHGHPEFYFHLPMAEQKDFPKEKRFEGILRLDLVYEHIADSNPGLADEIFG